MIERGINAGLHRQGNPVIEVFGPTIQGEGPDAGRRCWFVRFGGCDYRCSWCDSMHAVDPEQVRANATRMTTGEIIDALQRLRFRRGSLVILSGGNPALHDLGNLVANLHGLDARVSVETQGSVWRPWLADVDRLVVSPKPPSSGMHTAGHAEQFARFMGQAVKATLTARQRIVLKIVIADETDYQFARAIGMRYPWAPLYLSVMTAQHEREFVRWDDQDVEGLDWDDRVKLDVGDRYRWLCERVVTDDIPAVVLPQLHVIAWGTRQGV